MGGIGKLAKGIGSAASSGKKGSGNQGIGQNAAFAAQQASTNMGNFYADAGLGTSSMATAARSFPFIAAGAAADQQNQQDLQDALMQLDALQGQQSATNTSASQPGGTGTPASGGTSPDSGGVPVV